MSTIKSFTDLQQSKRLAEILSLESADMVWATDDDIIVVPYDVVTRENILHDFIPCWSLATLLDVLPQEIFYGQYIINITEGCGNRWVLTYDHNENRNHSYYSLSIGADNLVDACVSMIEKLHELNLL